MNGKVFLLNRINLVLRNEILLCTFLNFHSISTFRTLLFCLIYESILFLYIILYNYRNKITTLGYKRGIYIFSKKKEVYTSQETKIFVNIQYPTKEVYTFFSKSNPQHLSLITQNLTIYFRILWYMIHLIHLTKSSFNFVSVKTSSEKSLEMRNV